MTYRRTGPGFRLRDNQSPHPEDATFEEFVGLLVTEYELLEQVVVEEPSSIVGVELHSLGRVGMHTEDFVDTFEVVAAAAGFEEQVAGVQVVGTYYYRVVKQRRTVHVESHWYIHWTGCVVAAVQAVVVGGRRMGRHSLVAGEGRFGVVEADVAADGMGKWPGRTGVLRNVAAEAVVEGVAEGAADQHMTSGVERQWADHRCFDEDHAAVAAPAAHTGAAAGVAEECTIVLEEAVCTVHAAGNIVVKGRVATVAPEQVAAGVDTAAVAAAARKGDVEHLVGPWRALALAAPYCVEHIPPPTHHAELSHQGQGRFQLAKG